MRQLALNMATSSLSHKQSATSASCHLLATVASNIDTLLLGVTSVVDGAGLGSEADGDGEQDVSRRRFVLSAMRLFFFLGASAKRATADMCVSHQKARKIFSTYSRGAHIFRLHEFQYTLHDGFL
jgi:hypothetical protein